MNEINIEFAHIYADESFSEEQKASCDWFKKLSHGLKGKKFCSVVMIDDYNPGYRIDYHLILNKLKKERVMPDFIAFERDLVDIAPNILNALPRGRKVLKNDRLYLDAWHRKILLKNHGKYSCALLIACWILARLGEFTVPLIRLGEKEFKAKEVMTLLPQKYLDVELKAIEILKSTKYRRHVDRINHLFFSSDRL